MRGDSGQHSLHHSDLHLQVRCRAVHAAARRSQAAASRRAVCPPSTRVEDFGHTEDGLWQPQQGFMHRLLKSMMMMILLLLFPLQSSNVCQVDILLKKGVFISSAFFSNPTCMSEKPNHSQWPEFSGALCSCVRQRRTACTTSPAAHFFLCQNQNILLCSFSALSIQMIELYPTAYGKNV